MNPIFMLIYMILNAMFWVIVISVVMSWLVAFNVINLQNRFVAQVFYAVNKMTEPLYRPIKRIFPTNFGGIDIAPVIAIFLLEFAKYSLVWLSANYGL